MNLPHVRAFQTALDTLARSFGARATQARRPSTPTPSKGVARPWLALGVPSRRVWRERRAANRCPVHDRAFVRRNGTRFDCPVSGCAQTKRAPR